MEAELERCAKAFETPQRPLAAIVGGAKVSTKLDLLGNLLPKVDALIIGGGMANTFLAAQGKAVGKSLCEHELMRHRARHPGQGQGDEREIVLPVDAVVGAKFAAMRPRASSRSTRSAADDMILDIGPRSVEHVVSVLAARRRWCGTARSAPSRWSRSTTARIEVAEAGSRAHQPPGSSSRLPAAAIRWRRSTRPRCADRLTYVSTAGGAFLEWLEGKPLPGVEVLRVNPHRG